MSNGNKKSCNIQSFFFTGKYIFYLKAIHRVFSQNLYCFGIPQYFNIRRIKHPLLHGLGCP